MKLDFNKENTIQFIMKKLKKLQSAETAKPSSLAIHQEYQRLVSLEIKESFL